MRPLARSIVFEVEVAMAVLSRIEEYRFFEVLDH